MPLISFAILVCAVTDAENLQIFVFEYLKGSRNEQRYGRHRTSLKFEHKIDRADENLDFGRIFCIFSEICKDLWN